MNVPRTTIYALIVAALAGPAYAYQTSAVQAAATASSCQLLTEDECRAHLEKLSTLTDASDRRVYLSTHENMIRERSAMCGSTHNMRALLSSY